MTSVKDQLFPASSFLHDHILFKKELAAKYGPEKAAAIWQYAEHVLQKLEAAEPNADKNSRTFVFPAVALYRAVDRYAPDEALAVTRAYGMNTGIRMRNIFRKMTAFPGIPTLMWKNMDKIAAKMSSGYECRDVVVTDHLCSLDVTGCPLYDKAKALGTPEAVQMICCMDKEYMTEEIVDEKRGTICSTSAKLRFLIRSVLPITRNNTWRIPNRVHVHSSMWEMNLS